MRRMLALLLILSLLALAGGFAGPWHPAGDSLAVLRPVFALAAVLLGALLGGWGLIGAGIAALALAPMLWQARPVAEFPTELTVYQKNLLFTLESPDRIIADLRDSGADIITLQEVSRRNLAVPQALAGSHPHQVICPAHSVGAVAVLSRWPIEGAPICAEGTGFAAARILAPEGPLTVAVLHLHWPWPYGQAAHVDGLLPHLRELPGPVIVAGDFNAMPWSHTVARIAGATATQRVRPIWPSFVLKRLYPMTIDHVLLPHGWQGRAIMRPQMGSDHRGLIARLRRAKM